MATYQYQTQGTCSRAIQFTLDGDQIKDVAFMGGCNGNLKGIGRLVEGQNAAHIAELLTGTTCGFRDTSCPDQLAHAIAEAQAIERGERFPGRGIMKVD